MDYSISSGYCTHSKNFKTPFFGDIWNSCHWVTDMGLEPQQKNSFGNIWYSCLWETDMGLEPHQRFFLKISQKL